MTPHYSKFRTVPPGLLSPSFNWIYGDTTTITVWSEPILTVVIQNKLVAENYRAYFRFLWKLGSKTGVLRRSLKPKK